MGSLTFSLADSACSHCHYLQSSPSAHSGMLPLSEVPFPYFSGDEVTLKHIYPMFTLKCWTLTCKKLEKIRASVGLDQKEVGWCGEHGGPESF